MRTLLLIVALGLAPLSAAPVFTPAAGTIKLFTLFFGDNLAAYDLREGTIVFVSNPDPVGAFVIVGGDPSTVLNPPNTALVALNGAYTEGFVLFTETPTFSANSAEMKIASFAPIAAITDPALPLVPEITGLSFSNKNFELTSNGFDLFSWTLSGFTVASSVVIPEPGTWSLVLAASGLAVLARRRR